MFYCRRRLVGRKNLEQNHKFKCDNDFMRIKKKVFNPFSTHSYRVQQAIKIVKGISVAVAAVVLCVQSHVVITASRD